MDVCPFCGQPLEEGARFCGACGRSLTEAGGPADSPAEAPAQEPVQEPAAMPVAAPTIVELPPKNQTLTTGQYVLLWILFHVPVIGLVCLFIFGAGHPKNISLKRFSAALLILRLLGWILALVCLIVGLVRNGSLLAAAMQRAIPALVGLLAALFA